MPLDVGARGRARVVRDHAKRGAELLRVSVVAWSGSDHFLQCDHVSVDTLKHLGDSLRAEGLRRADSIVHATKQMADSLKAR